MTKNRPFEPYERLPVSRQRNMAKGYDFLPLLSLNSEYNPNLEVYTIKGETSKVAKGGSWTGKSQSLTKYGSIEQKPSNRQVSKMNQGSLHPFDSSGVDLKRAKLDDLAQATLRPLRTDEMNIERIGFRFTLPEVFRDRGITNNATMVAHEMVKTGNSSKDGKGPAGLDVYSPFSAIKRRIGKDGYDTSTIEKMLQGHLVTNGVYLDNGVSHIELQEEGMLTGLLRSVHSTSRFMWDIGVPEELSQKHGGRVYKLDKAGQIMTK